MRAIRFWLLSLAVARVLAAQAAPPAELAQAAAGYAAKVAASAIFVSGRTLDSVLAEEFAPTRPLDALIRPLLRFEVDREASTVTCRVGQARATAVRTRNLGCTLAIGGDLDGLRRRGAPGLADLRPLPANVDWPAGDRMPALDSMPAGTAVQAVIDRAFAKGKNGQAVNTRAVVVVHKGRLIAERYADGYDAAMPLPGWSMTKTLTHALLGLRQQDGKFDPDAPLPVPEWVDGDPRQRLRTADLLAMRGGLRWNENYDDPTSDALRMLFGSADMAAVYAQQPVAAEPGEQFVYASGATNLLCRVLRSTFAADADYWAFPQRLFDALGMRSAVLETDTSGTFVGSSYCFASARDWARFGLLYLGDGTCGGERILPAGYVAAATAVPVDSDGRYGAHVWCNRDPDGDGPRSAPWPGLPQDLLRMDGHEGQYVFVVPSAELVLVRLGCTKTGGFDVKGLLADAIAATRSAASLGR
jgi:CubicO group peptidase (beta-lactamase class C family)